MKELLMRARRLDLSVRDLGFDILVAVVSVCLCVTSGGWIDALRAGEGPGVQRVHPFELKQVRLLDGPLKQATERDQKYLRGLELDRLLHNFRVAAGLPSNAKPLGGWENPTTELRGHFVGHFLSACAMMYASFDARVLKAKADTVVAGLARCQEALGNGYLSAFPEEFIDRVETGKRVWAPWYTLHKILAGLLDMYTLTGNTQALLVAEGMADWAKRRTDRLDEPAMQRMLKVEFGGMSEALFNLYAATGDANYSSLARRFEKREFLEPLADHADRLKGLHVNTHIPQVIGAARGYEITGEPAYRSIASYFWREIVNARSYATGGTSWEELWGGDPYHLATQLGSSNQESCTSYNMLKLTSHLFTWDPDPAFADYYELLFFNGILPTQNPSDGMLMYYLPLGSGWYKTFGTPRNSFWCCTGTGVESFARLGSDIYYHGENDLYVNLFIPSEVRWDEKGLTLRQQTDFPRTPRTQLQFRISKPVSFSLHIRVPEWSANGAHVRLNGRDLGVTSSPRSYLVLTRTWHDGDWVDVEYKMDLHVKPLPDDPGVAAIMYGPVVLAGQLGSEGITDSLIHGFYGPSRPPVLTPSLVVTSRDVHSWVVPVSGRPLTFRTKGVGIPHDVELIPLYELFDERYAVYWRICDKEGWEEAKKESEMMIGRVVDNVSPGDSNSVEAHTLAGAGVDSGRDAGTGWVRTRDWMLYSLKVLLNRPVQLNCTWMKSDTARAYTIRIDGVRITLKPESTELSNGMVEERYELPLATTFGRHSVAVTFETAGGGPGKKLFGCSIIGSAAKGD
jgi:DUF1680 family protein